MHCSTGVSYISLVPVLWRDHPMLLCVWGMEEIIYIPIYLYLEEVHVMVVMTSLRFWVMCGYYILSQGSGGR